MPVISTLGSLSSRGLGGFGLTFGPFFDGFGYIGHLSAGEIIDVYQGDDGTILSNGSHQNPPLYVLAKISSIVYLFRCTNTGSITYWKRLDSLPSINKVSSYFIYGQHGTLAHSAEIGISGGLTNGKDLNGTGNVFTNKPITFMSGDPFNYYSWNNYGYVYSSSSNSITYYPDLAGMANNDYGIYGKNKVYYAPNQTRTTLGTTVTDIENWSSTSFDIYSHSSGGDYYGITYVMTASPSGNVRHYVALTDLRNTTSAGEHTLYGPRIYYDPSDSLDMTSVKVWDFDFVDNSHHPITLSNPSQYLSYNVNNKTIIICFNSYNITAADFPEPNWATEIYTDAGPVNVKRLFSNIDYITLVTDTDIISMPNNGKIPRKGSYTVGSTTYHYGPYRLPNFSVGNVGSVSISTEITSSTITPSITSVTDSTTSTTAQISFTEFGAAE